MCSFPFYPIEDTAFQKGQRPLPIFVQSYHFCSFLAKKIGHREKYLAEGWMCFVESFYRINQEIQTN
ncbi:MAG: hypothetical protein DYG87_05545 [Anaerolineae bacterium CFX3]|nr:hypothetical protein [Anaerolineae bacterium CFX3]